MRCPLPVAHCLLPSAGCPLPAATPPLLTHQPTTTLLHQYWARYRQGSWQGEIRDEGAAGVAADEDERLEARKVKANATEDEYWAAY
mmetsp:Transcript_15120/g.38222  ORF Transcript_15120/g.38222 Transcript_15120/m.38222 type:complete len:87 (-) Transcript_15120:305-565(-)